MRWSVLVLTVMLAGCAGIEAQQRAEQRDTEANSVFPSKYKDEILALMRTYLNNPTNVRNAFVTQPTIRKFDGNLTRYAVCLRYNAKNTTGQYTGNKDNIVLFRMGKLERMVDNPREVRDLCKDAPYQPFPELEKLSR